MIRALKTGCTANWLVAVLVVAGYITYGLSAGLPIDQHFLGSGPWRLGRGGGPRLPSWTFPAIVESVLLATFMFGRIAGWNTGRHRLFCGMLGVLALFFLFVPVLQIRPPISDEGDILPRPTISTVLTLDGWIAVYVWCSHVLYAIVGSNRAGPTE